MDLVRGGDWACGRSLLITPLPLQLFSDLRWAEGESPAPPRPCGSELALAVMDGHEHVLLPALREYSN